METQVLYTADSVDSPTWANISAPITRTGFETEVDISAANHSSLVRAKAVNGDGEKLGWTDAADGNSNYFEALDLDDSQIAMSDDPSSATVVTPSSIPTQTRSAISTASIAASASSTPTGAASIPIVHQSFVLEILVAAVALAGSVSF